MEQSIAKELNPTNGQFVDCSSPTFSPTVEAPETFFIRFALPNRLDLKYPQTAVCGIRTVVSPVSRLVLNNLQTAVWRIFAGALRFVVVNHLASLTV
jgi:hypothetical protein